MWRGWIYLRGLRRHNEALMTVGNGAPGFVGRPFDRSCREYGLRNETRTGRGPDVDNPVVVNPRALDLEIESLNGADCLTADACRRGIEHGIIDPVGIHRGQPRMRIVDALGISRQIAMPRYHLSKRAWARKSVSLKNATVFSLGYSL